MSRIGERNRTAAIGYMTAVWMLTATAMLAQGDAAQTGAPVDSQHEDRIGLSRPDPKPITVVPYSDDDASIVESVHATKTSTSLAPTTAAPLSLAPGSSAKVSVDPAFGVQTVYGAYTPYRDPQAAEPGPHLTKQSATAATHSTTSKGTSEFDPDANIVTEQTVGLAERRQTHEVAVQQDVDAGIVTHIPTRPGEIPDGTLVKVRLHDDLSTLTTAVGTSFTAEVSEPVMRDNQVVVPVGSTLEGRVTLVRGGKRIGGAAAIHLEPRTVTLPDGSQYLLHARVIDTDSWDDSRVDSEGTILRKDHAKATAAVTSLTAGGGLAAGAMLGGLPGALIGAGVGAGVSTVVWARQDRQADLPKDLGIVFSLTEPMRVTPISAHLTQPATTSLGAE
jgi:hypothetical protein